MIKEVKEELAVRRKLVVLEYVKETVQEGQSYSSDQKGKSDGKNRR